MLTPLIAALWLACSGSDRPSDGPPAPDPAPAPAPAPFSYEPTPERHPVQVPTEPLESFALSDRLPEGFPDLRTTGARQFPLHTMEGRYELSGVARAKGTDDVSEVFVVDHSELPNPRKAKRVLEVIQAPLPFPIRPDQATFRPEDLRVFIGEEELPFSKSPAPNARKSTWRITGKKLILSHPTVPPPGTVRVVYPRVQEILDRRDPATADLDPFEFVQGSLTVDRHTRHGLVLPAPSAAEWDVDVPPKARFQTYLSILEPPLSKPRSDGADVVLTVTTADGETTEVARKSLEGKQRAFVPWEEDLSAWAGQQVTVRLATETGRTHAFDWVFLGSPTVWGEPADDVRRIVVIGLDTTRYDRLSTNGYERPTTPELDAFSDSGVVFDQAWTPAPRTRPSFRSATTGRRPLEAVGATNISEVLQGEHFATAGIVANPHLQPRFDFDQGFDSWHFDGRANAAQQVEMALGWLQDNVHRDTYLFLHFMDAHMIYDAPGEWRNKFADPGGAGLPKRVRRSEVLGMMKRGNLTDAQKDQLQGLHDGEMAYMSHELGRFFDAVDELPGKTLYVLHSDHGEEFWEHDGFEHNHTLYDEVTRAALVLRPGGGLKEGRRLDHPATLADIGPTLYDFVGVDDPPATDGRSLVRAMNGQDWSQRPIPVAHIQYSHERWGVVFRGHKYVLHTGSGDEELYDLARDPAEQVDLSDQVDLDPWREQLSQSHTIPVQPGWRVPVKLDRKRRPEVVIELPQEADAAGVLDPEAIAEHRANVEWGEIPKKLPADVGEVELSADARTVTYRPGPKPDGMLYVLFAEPADAAAATVTVDGQEVALLTDPSGAAAWSQGNQQLELRPGTVVIPPPTEADRMGLGPGAEGATDEMDLLRELGYVGD